MSSSRAVRWLIAMAALFAIVTLIGCGGDDDNGSADDAATTEVEATGSEGESFNVAMASIGPVDDKAFNQSHWEGVQQGAEATGATLASPIENLEDPQGRIDAFRNLAATNDLIVGASASFAQAAEVVAPQQPDQFFIVSAGSPDEFFENVLSVVPDEGVPAYINGVAMAMLTESNKVGVLGGAEIPPTMQSMVGFKAGVESVDPNIDVAEAIVGNFNDVALAKAAAAAMIANGVDNIFAFLDAGIAGVYQAAEEAGSTVNVSGIIIPQCDAYENYMGVSTLHNDVLMANVIEEYAEGTLEPGARFYGVEDPEIQAFELCPGFDEGEVAEAVAETTDQIVSGEIVLPEAALNSRPDYYEE